MRWYSWVLLACVPAGMIVFAAAMWFLPCGTAEYGNSPDGRFTAHASNLSRGTMFSGRVQYVELLVVESATEREVWRVHFRHQGSAKVPDFGDRSQKFIKWTQDSSSVTIPVGVERQVTLPVP